MVEKVLDQNPKSYTKLDDLLSIGRNLVLAGFSPRPADETSHSQYTRQPVLSQDDALITAERRIMSLAISSALSSNDFGTAYSYILTRLSPPTPSTPPSTTPSLKDDITWRAVYNAGRYRPNKNQSSTSPPLTSQITHLTQRMDLLSLSLILTPTPDPLPEILGAWRRADEELSLLRAQETAEEDAWDTKGDNAAAAAAILPGGFSQPDSEQDAYETRQVHARRAARAAHHSRIDSGEAPMGLFEVARGAARALHKNVNSSFPAGGAASTGASASASASVDASAPMSVSSSMSLVEGDAEGYHEESNGGAYGYSDDEDGEAGRLRKRDMVSNMVTGGLASGIGWVLGAQPVNMNNR